MRLDLEVLALAEDVLRDEAAKSDNESWSEHVEDIADRLADIIEHLDPDNG